MRETALASMWSITHTPTCSVSSLRPTQPPIHSPEECLHLDRCGIGARCQSPRQGWSTDLDPSHCSSPHDLPHAPPYADTPTDPPTHPPVVCLH